MDQNLHSNSYTTILHVMLSFQYWKDIMPLYWPMDRLAPEKLTILKVSLVTLKILKEVLYLALWKKYLDISKALLIRGQLSW